METMEQCKVRAYAKLNLTLEITGREEGYHLLDSLVVTVSLFDKIIAKKRRDKLINVYMHGMGSDKLSPEENNAVKAAEMFVERFHTAGANITIHKNIPMEAGLGGSSADAAGVIRALAKLYKIEDTKALKALADELGSDTGYLLSGGFARLTGRGERVERLGDCPEMHFLLLCPKAGVSTKECFEEFDKAGAQASFGRTERCLDALYGFGLSGAAKVFGNDLYAAAKTLEPAVGEALVAVKALSPSGASMTGSGSAVFGLFETRELAEWAKSRYKGKCRAYVVRAEEIKEKRRKNLYSVEEE